VFGLTHEIVGLNSILIVKKQERTIVVSVFLLLPVIILASALWSRRDKLRNMHENSKEAFAKHDNEVVAQWRTNVFVSLDSTNETRDHLSALISSNTNNAILPQQQKESLASELRVFFAAFNAGTYEAYCEFRFPQEVKWHWKTKAQAELTRYFKEGPLFGSDAMFYSFRTNYGYYPTKKITRTPPDGMEARFKEYVFQYSNRSYYSNFLTGINYDQAQLVLYESEGLPAQLTQTPFSAVQKQKCATMARPFPNLGFADSKDDTLLEFDDSIERVVAAKGKVEIADALFLVDTSPPDAPFPILIRLYWSPDDAKWLPDDIVTGTLNTLVLRQPIF
jgi:hypothetical protein